MPALQMRTSMAAAFRSLARRAIAARSVTSARCTSTPLPRAESLAPAFGSRTVPITFQPSAAYCRARSNPRPRPAPVMRTVGISAPAPRGDFDRDLHPRIGEAAEDDRRRRADIPERVSEHGAAGLPILAVGQVIARTHDIGERRAAVSQRLGDGAQALARLLGGARRNGHGRVLETGGAGHEDEIAVDHGAAGAPFRLVSRPPRTDANGHSFLLAPSPDIISRWPLSASSLLIARPTRSTHR